MSIRSDFQFSQYLHECNLLARESELMSVWLPRMLNYKTEQSFFDRLKKDPSFTLLDREKEYLLSQWCRLNHVGQTLHFIIEIKIELPPKKTIHQEGSEMRQSNFLYAILGFITFAAITVYQWLPFFGALSIITGIIGFFTGSSVAGRAFVLGVILLGVRYLVALILQKMIDRG